MSKALVIHGADFSANKVDTIIFDVIHATSITLNKSALSFEELNTSEALSCAILPVDAEDPVRWSSSDENVATVTDGVVVAVGCGSCTITAAAGSVSDTCTVTVTEEVVMQRFRQTLISSGTDENRLTATYSTYVANVDNQNEWMAMCGSVEENPDLILSFEQIHYDSANATMVIYPLSATSGPTPNAQRVAQYLKYPVAVLLPANATKVLCIAPSDDYGCQVLFYKHDVRAGENGSQTANKGYLQPYRDLAPSIYQGHTSGIVYTAEKEFDVPSGYDAISVTWLAKSTAADKFRYMSADKLAQFRVIAK